jgi:hypothetical protein
MKIIFSSHKDKSAHTTPHTNPLRFTLQDKENCRNSLHASIATVTRQNREKIARKSQEKSPQESQEKSPEESRENRKKNRHKNRKKNRQKNREKIARKIARQ